MWTVDCKNERGMKEKMKKNGVRNIVAVLLVCIMLCTLSACSLLLKGKYVAKDSPIEQSFIFKDGGKVGVSAFGIEIEGDYVIKNGQITVTYSLLNLSYDWVKRFEKKGNSIFIDGTEFVKEK